MEFRPLKSKVVGDVVQRLQVKLGDVALCRTPAYAGAQITATREHPAEAHG